MGEEKDLSALQDRIKALEEENARLKKRQQPSLSTRVVPMEPVDYDDLKRNNRILQSKLKKYRQILSLGGISELPLFIDQYLEASDRKLKQISAEVRMMDFDTAELPKILKLIDHLDYAKQELSSFITMYQEGKWISDPLMHKVQLDIECIQGMLGRKSSLYAIPEDRLSDFDSTLVNIIEVLSGFMQKEKS